MVSPVVRPPEGAAPDPSESATTCPTSTNLMDAPTPPSLSKQNKASFQASSSALPTCRAPAPPVLPNDERAPTAAAVIEQMRSTSHEIKELFAHSKFYKDKVPYT